MFSAKYVIVNYTKNMVWDPYNIGGIQLLVSMKMFFLTWEVLNEGEPLTIQLFKISFSSFYL